jgi:Uma2 family endonuclease
MATGSITNESLAAVAPELCPNVEHLVTEDDTPVDGVLSEKQMRLLTEPLFTSWSGPGEGRTFVALANVGLFYSVDKPPYVPDVMLSVDVELPPNVKPKPFRSYFVWLYGKPPDVVVEVVSNREGGEDTHKFTGYARLGVRYYAIFDPELLLSDELLRVFRLEGMKYRRMVEPIWLDGVELGLRIWHGRFEDHENTWLRWVDANGIPVPTGAEAKNQEQQRADQAEQRADQAEQRAESLAEQLRRMGTEPKA